uniref:Putative 5.3 kDa protein n=1 Tax=Ixodes ricinus TaxID=34613 RepID=A0A0K8RKX4_IXORI
MRVLAIVIISLLFLECFYFVNSQRFRPGGRPYKKDKYCRRPCEQPYQCGPPCPKCPETNPWNPPKCTK